MCLHSITSSVNFQLRTLFALWIVPSSKMVSVRKKKQNQKKNPPQHKKNQQKVQINHHPACTDENGLNLPANQAD